MPTELELDHLFWAEVSTNPNFCDWVISKTKFAAMRLRLVTDEKWHQRWYRDPVTRQDSETDILLVFVDSVTADRYALHIENKPSHRRWEPLQPENYRKRALDRMEKWRYADFQTALLAPQQFITRSASEAAHFDVMLPYEEVAQFVPAFSANPLISN